MLQHRAIKSRASKRRNHTAAGILFALPWIIGFLAFSLYPIIMSVYYSLTDFNMFQTPKFVGLENYSALFQDEKFYKSLGNTLYMTILGTPLCLVAGLLLAVLLNQKVRAMPIFRTFFYLPSIVPLVASSMLWLWILNPQYGLLNNILQKLGLYQPNWLTAPRFTKPALLIMGVWGVGSIMIIFLAALQDVPRTLYEAAEIDGANALKRFFYITLPGISPAIFFQLIMGIINNFQYFTQAYLMIGSSTGGGLNVVSGGAENSLLFYALYLYQNAFNLFKMGKASAMAWILFVVVAVVTAVVFKTQDRWVNNASLARANKNIRRRKLCGKAVTVFLLVALSVVFLVPFAWMLLTSLKSMEEVYQRTIFPTKLHFDNYILAVTQIPFLRYAWNTIVITALCVVGTVISSAMVAYSMSKVRWNGKKYLFPIIVATMMIPYQVTLIPLYMIWNKLGLIGSIAPLVVPAFFGGAYYIFLLRQFFKSIPDSLLEAAEIDGAGEVRIFAQIMLPLCKPAMASVAIFTFINTWSDFMGPMLYLNRQESYTLSIGLQAFLQQHYVQWGILMAASAIFTLPMLVLFFFAQKYFIEGITVTGVKG